jgi:hypothetical protein
MAPISHMLGCRIGPLILMATAILTCCRPARAAAVLEDVIEKTYVIDPRARVSIQNDEGSIQIYGADINELKMQAIKRAYNAERLAKISINVSVRPGEISIDTQYPPKPKWGWSDRSGTVDYIIILPWTCDVTRLELGNGEVVLEDMRGDNVHANLGNGRLYGHNCFSDLHVSVANGGLDIGYDWWETHRFSVDAQIVNGNARVFIPGEAAFRLAAASVNGHVASDFIEKEDRRQNGPTTVEALIGGPSETDIKIRAINGNIKIAEANP